MLRNLLLLVVLVGAVGVPYLLMSDDGLPKLKQTVMEWFDNSGQDDQDGEAAGPGIGVPGSPPVLTPTSGPVGPVPPTLAGPPVHRLEEVLRFDINPQWITGRWSRVSTSLAELDLHGMRVPLVTGVATDDLAGTLTYYFDKSQRVQRITFEGNTGNPQKLVELMSSKPYGLRDEPSLGAGLYLAKWGGKPNSMLRIQHAAIVSAGSPHTRYDVLLELNDARLKYGLSPRFRQILDRDKQAGRW